MSNTIDITRPSYLGIPNCINETVSITNDLAQCVGTDARWLSAVRRSMTGEVAGECYKTDAALPETVNMIRYGQLIQARLTAEEVTADRVGRAVTQYRYRLQEGVPYLPQKDKLVCLYVPKWQDDHEQTLHDFSGKGRDLNIERGSLTDDYAYRVLASTASFSTQETHDYTYAIKRELRSDGVGFGLTLHNSSLNLLINEMNYIEPPSTWSCGEYARLGAFSDNAEIYGRRNDYCGRTINAGVRTQFNRIRLNMRADGVRPARPLYDKVYYIAVWSVSLTDTEIRLAQMYLAQQSRPADI